MEFNTDKKTEEQLALEAAQAEAAQKRAEMVQAQPKTSLLQPDKIRELLLDLVPEAGGLVKWGDIAGNRYSAPGVLGARKQTVLLEMLREEAGPLAAALQEVAKGGGLAGLMMLVADARTLEALHHAFSVLHPEAIKQARQLQQAPENADAMDLFGIEDMLVAVVPFFARPVAVLLGMGNSEQ